jgi:hypothetical protein
MWWLVLGAALAQLAAAPFYKIYARVLVAMTRPFFPTYSLDYAQRIAFYQCLIASPIMLLVASWHLFV